MSNNDTDFSASAELALQVPESEKRRVEGEVSDIGPVMLSAGAQGGPQPGGGGGLGQQLPDSLTELETMADLAEEQLRVGELQNDLLRELLEDSGAALAGGDGAGGGVGGVAGGGGILARVAGVGGGLAAGGVSATTLGIGAAAAALPYAAFGGDIKEDTNVPTNAQGEPDLFANLPDLGLERPSWLTADGTIGVEDPGTVRVDLVEETTAAGGETPAGSPGGSSAPTEDVGGPTGTPREDLVDDTLEDGSAPSGSRDGGSPGGSTPPISDIGGPGEDASTGAGLVEDVLGDVGTTPDGSPGGSTPSRTGGLNEAAARRRGGAPNIDVEARVEGNGISEREAERIAEDKATEAAEEIRNEIQRPRR